MWLRSLRVSIAVACLFALSGMGAVTAHQRGDAWTELGEDFESSPANTESSAIVGDTYVLPASGAEVVIAEGYVPEESDFEDQLIINTQQGMGAIAVIPGAGSARTTMETYADAFGAELDGAEQIDAQSDSESASGIYSVEVLGLDMVMFITVDSAAMPGYQTIQIVIAETDIAGAITTFREIVALNGQPMFIDIDESEVQDTVDQHIGI